MNRKATAVARALALLALGSLGVASRVSADEYLKLTNVTSNGFTGWLGTTYVTGTLTDTRNIYFNTPNNGSTSRFSTHTNDSSAQYRYSNVYALASPNLDQVGFQASTIRSSDHGDIGNLTLTFSKPIGNLDLDIAGLTATTMTFANTGGVTGISYGSGNGGSSATDGLGVDSATGEIYDINPNTSSAQPTTQSPLTTGPRSAYGSIGIDGGAISTITISWSDYGNLNDYGSFTLHTTPEPGTYGLLIGFTLASGSMFVRRRRRA